MSAFNFYFERSPFYRWYAELNPNADTGLSLGLRSFHLEVGGVGLRIDEEQVQIAGPLGKVGRRFRKAEEPSEGN